MKSPITATVSIIDDQQGLLIGYIAQVQWKTPEDCLEHFLHGKVVVLGFKKGRYHHHIGELAAS